MQVRRPGRELRSQRVLTGPSGCCQSKRDLKLLPRFATTATLAVLIGLRWIELSVPRQVYALARLRFDHQACPSQNELRAWLGERGLRMSHVSYRKLDDGKRREPSGTVQARREADFVRLEDDLSRWPGLVEYDFARNNK